MPVAGNLYTLSLSIWLHWLSLLASPLDDILWLHKADIIFRYSANTSVSMWKCPQKTITAKFILASPGFFSLSWLSYGILCEMGGKQLYSCCFVGLPGLIQKQHEILLYSFHIAFSPSIFLNSKRCNHTRVLTRLQFFIFAERSEFHVVVNLSIAIHTLPMCIMTSLSVNEILLPRYMSWSSNLWGSSFNEEMASSCLKPNNSVLSEFTKRPMPLAVCSRLCRGDPASAGVFARSARSSA